MNIFKYPRTRSVVGLMASLAVSMTAQAQTATWNNLGGDNNWNNGLNWDVGTPLEGTNAIIGAAAVVNYNAPMVATSFAGVNNSGALTVNAAGFNIDAATLAAYTGNAASLLRINASGVVVATNSGTIGLTTGSEIDVQGGTLIITNSTGNITFGANANNAGAGFTNNGGTVIFSQPFQSRGRFSRFEMLGGSLTLQNGGGIFESSNDQERKFLINGGVANLGNFTIGRTLNTLGTAGLVLSNGVVNLTSLIVGNGNAAGGTTIFGGALTNTGTFNIADRPNAATTGERRVRFFMRGGTVVSTAVSGIVIANQANITNTGGANVWGGILDMSAGTLIAEKLTLVGPNALTNAHATLILAGSASLYLGSGGLVGNVGYSNTSFTMTLSGGTLGANADYSITGNGALSGTFTVKSSDLANTPRNITHNGVWSGAGALVKNGGGVLTFNANNTYSGATILNEGTLALGVSGGIANSTSFTLGSGAVLDVSAATAGFTLGASKTIAGFGSVTGNFTNASASTINPGSNTVAGTLTFANSLNQSGGTVNHFDLPVAPGPSNDRIVVSGDLNVSGVNTVEIAGGGAPGSVHTLFQYGGNFNGTVANFTLVGATGSLSNNPTTKTISLVVASAIRNSTNVVWLGNGLNNDWDLVNRTNWQHTGTGLLTYFVSGDNVLFNAAGAANPNVNIIGNVAPATLTVGAAANYTLGGSGSISGTGGLTKTNTGILTVNSTNSYSGVTTVSGGVLEASTLANGGLNSAIGSATAASANLVIDGATLRYTGGNASTDRGATLNAAGGAIDVANGATALSMSGTITGAGALIKSGAGNLTLTSANTHTGGTIISNGTLQLNIAGAAGTTGITNYGATIRGPSGATVTHVNIMEVNGNTTIDCANSSGDLHLNGAWIGSGTINVINFANAARTLTLGGNGNGGGSMAAFTGTINMGTNSGQLRYNDGGANANLGNPAMTLDLGTGAADFKVRNGGVTVDIGAFSGGAGTFLTGRASGAAGTVTYSIGALNVPNTFAGTIRNGNNATAITKVGTAKLTLTGTNTYTGLTLVNAGTLQVDGALAGTASVTVFGGTLAGSGSISGTVDVQSGAYLAPGASIGQLTMTSSLTLQPGSTNIMEINKSLGANDSVVGLASVTYGGTLVVNNLAGTLAEFDSFKLFDAASYAGAYDFLELPALGTGLFWDTSKLAVNGTISVIRLRPTITEFGVNGSNFFLNGTNGGNTSTHYIIVTSTDVAAPLASWTPLVTNLFGGGNFTFTNAVNTAEEKRFYNVKTP